MKKIILPFLISTCLIQSCGTKESTSGVTVVSVNPTELVPVNELFSSVKVVPLEQKEDALFGLLFSKIDFYNNRLYIAPGSYGRKKILIYDLEGRHLRSIDNFGPGPDQLKRLYKFRVMDDEHIELATSSGYMLYRYNMKHDTVEWRKNFKGNSFGEFVKRRDGEGYYLARGVTAADFRDPLFWLSAVDSELEEEKEYFEGRPMKPKATRMPTLYHTIQWLDDELRFLPPYSDTIFSLQNDVEIPRYKLDFGKYKKYNSQNVDGIKVDEVFKNRNGVRAINFFEANNQLVLTYFYGKSMLTLYDKKKGTIKTTRISKSLLLDESFVLQPFYADDDVLICTFRSNNMTAGEYARKFFDPGQVEGNIGDYNTEDEIPEIVIFRFN